MYSIRKATFVCLHNYLYCIGKTYLQNVPPFLSKVMLCKQGNIRGVTTWLFDICLTAALKDTFVAFCWFYFDDWKLVHQLHWEIQTHINFFATQPAAFHCQKHRCHNKNKKYFSFVKRYTLQKCLWVARRNEFFFCVTEYTGVWKKSACTNIWQWPISSERNPA